MRRKTKRMLEVEERFHQPLDEILKKLYGEDMTMQEIAADLGVSKATIGFWLMKLDLRVERVVLSANEIAVVEQRNGTA